MHRLKNRNLISRFRADGIYPLDRCQVLKHLPTSNNESEEINLPLFNKSMLSVLKENCGIGAKKIDMPVKETRK